MIRILTEITPVMSILISIIGKILLICCVALRFSNMPYSFWHILIRYIFYWDIEPMRWLKDNIIYLYYLLFIVSQCILLLGLLHQLRLNRLEDKLPEFTIAAPLASISLIFILIHLFNTVDGWTKVKTFIKTIKYKQS